MSRILYDLAGAEDRRFSPNCWRIRYALAHKGLDYTTEPVLFTQKEKIAFCGGKTVPILVDGDRTIRTSWEIANYLEDAYPDAPSLMGDAVGRGLTGFMNAWADTVLHPAVIRYLLVDIFQHLDPQDQPYFRESREARFGKSLEAFCGDPEAALQALRGALAPVRTLLQTQEWIAGAQPAYADYLVMGALQWARIMCERPVLAEDDPVRDWRDRMRGLFDRISDTATPVYDAA